MCEGGEDEGALGFVQTIRGFYFCCFLLMQPCFMMIKGLGGQE